LLKAAKHNPWGLDGGGLINAIYRATVEAQPLLADFHPRKATRPWDGTEKLMLGFGVMRNFESSVGTASYYGFTF
jgi:hypothetical protein